MSAKHFVSGKPVEMCVVKTINMKNIEQRAHDYVSKIVECIDNRILAELPIKHGCLVRFNNSDIIHILGSYDGEYGSAYTRVIDIIQGDIPILVLELITEIERVQRRGLYRLSILKDIKFKVFSDDNTSAEHSAYLVNISGGGLAISSKQNLEEGSSILLQVDLDGEKIEVCGNIVRKQYIEDKKIYAYGVRFGSISRSLQDKIIRYIHREQIKRSKRSVRE